MMTSNRIEEHPDDVAHRVTVGATLRAHRKRCGITWEEMGRAMGAGTSSVGPLERGESFLFSTLAAYMIILGLEWEYRITGLPPALMNTRMAIALIHERHAATVEKDRALAASWASEFLIADLQARRKVLDVSTVELGNRMGVVKSAVSLAESGKRLNPSFGAWQRYTRSLGGALTVAVDALDL